MTVQRLYCANEWWWQGFNDWGISMGSVSWRQKEKLKRHEETQRETDGQPYAER